MATQWQGLARPAVEGRSWSAASSLDENGNAKILGADLPAPKSGKSASPRSLALAATLLYGGRDGRDLRSRENASLTEATTMGFPEFCSGRSLQDQ